MVPGELLGQNLRGDQEAVGGMAQAPRNLRRLIQSWDGVAVCKLGSDGRRDFQRLTSGASCHLPLWPCPDSPCGREAPHQ